MYARKSLSLGLIALAMGALSLPAPVEGEDANKSDVKVVNTPAEPVPVAPQGTTSVAGTVNIGNSPSVSVVNELAVGIRQDANTVRIAAPQLVQRYKAYQGCQIWLGFEPEQPMLIKRIYVSQYGPPKALARVETTIATDHFDGFPPIVVATPQIMAAPLQRLEGQLGLYGSAVLDFGETGLYVDWDRGQARLGDVVEVYIDTCDDGDNSHTGLQILVQGYPATR